MSDVLRSLTYLNSWLLVGCVGGYRTSRRWGLTDGLVPLHWEWAFGVAGLILCTVRSLCYAFVIGLLVSGSGHLLPCLPPRNLPLEPQAKINSVLYKLLLIVVFICSRKKHIIH